MIEKTTQIHRARGGFALVAVLWVVIIAGLLLLGVQKESRVNLATAHSELASVQAHWLARAGIERGLAVLTDDSKAADSMLDFWWEDTESFSSDANALAAGAFSVTAPPPEDTAPDLPRYGLIDHCALLNLNTADDKQLTKLFDFPDAHSQVGAILDWRDKDDNARTGGAESGYYHSLRIPYDIRNGPFQTVHELLQVRDIDQGTFRGEDANLNGVLDANEDDMDALFPNDDGDGELALGLSALTTVYSYELNRDADGNERVNISTADQNTLKQRLNFTNALASAVVQHRSRNRFQSLMDLLNVRVRRDRTGQSGNEGDQNRVNGITIKWLAEHLDELTLTNDERLPGKINVNTASRLVLLTLPKMTSTAADAIVARRSSDRGPFETVGELFTDRVVSEEQFKGFAEQLTVRSAVFEIRSSATTDWGIRHKITAVVDRGTDPPAILYWYQSE